MPLIRRRSSSPPEGPVGPDDFEVVAHDGWTRVLDDAPLPDGDVVVTHARLASERASLRARPGGLGVRWPNHLALDALVPDLPHLRRVELEFPKFTDGRSYTLARRLREAHGYRGEVVAVGDVLRDQLLYMHRCGFSAFELANTQRPLEALRAFADATVHYQAATDHALPLWKRAPRPPA